MGLSLSLFSLACNVMFPGDDQAVFQCSCAGAGCNVKHLHLYMCYFIWQELRLLVVTCSGTVTTGFSGRKM